VIALLLDPHGEFVDPLSRNQQDVTDPDSRMFLLDGVRVDETEDDVVGRK
jgi:hypothetical protein